MKYISAKSMPFRAKSIPFLTLSGTIRCLFFHLSIKYPVVRGFTAWTQQGLGIPPSYISHQGSNEIFTKLFKTTFLSSINPIRLKASSTKTMTSLANLEMSWDISSIQKWSDIPKDIVSRIVPRLTPNSHKGSYGRIGVLGGSERYTGAPFYSAMAALNTGSDLAFVFCAEEAAIPLKCYSPELMVTPVYVAKEFTKALDIDGDPGEQERDRLVTKMVSEVTSMFNRMHAIIIGPGLGRCPLVMRATAIIVQKAMEASLPLVLDADALHILTLKEYRYILNSEKPKKLAVITPNIVEYNRLMKSFENISPDEKALVREAYRDVIVVEKGFFDAIYFLSEALDTKDDPSHLFPSMMCKEDGGLKRSGGLGDILSGALGTHLAWNSILNSKEDDIEILNALRIVSCWSASCLTKKATAAAFERKRRAMQAPDVLEEIGVVFDKSVTSLLADETTHTV